MTFAETSRKRSVLQRFLLSLVLLAGVLPGSAMAWWNQSWAFRKQIVVDTGPTGANLQGESPAVPVLIRLHEGVFRFSDANQDGSDLRFVAEDDKTPLKYHVEKFDSVFNLAFVWVQVPQLKGGAQTKIWMYYGNAQATGEADPRDTYDANQTLVYHFGERNAPPADATGFRNLATSTVLSDDSGLIGGAAKFDGKSILSLPTSPSLAVAAGGALSWSAWIKPTADNQDAILYAQRDAKRAFVIGLAKGAPYVAVADDSGALRQSPLGSALAANGWRHLAVIASVVNGAPQIAVYIGGVAGPVLAASLPALNAGASLAGDGGRDGAPVTSGFAGEIDELEIAKTARDPLWLAVSAMNQGSEDHLIQFGGDEQISTWSSGYVGVLLHSVTLDGWVVIGVLMVMAVISWIIMATKARMIQRVSSANKSFLTLFRAAAGDFGALNHLAAGTAAAKGVELSERKRKQMQQSPLLHMFKAGIEELRQRVNKDDGPNVRETGLSAQSIEAIRATLDASLVREMQSLNRLMVLLTVAISGGPFIGLLGTVVGVMITFAAIAVAGDVNVNAIAPGIAAALVATVAGLFVAIPALFGYNYLISRVKEIGAEMQVFLDAFVTRMAENYSDPAALRAMASED